VDARLSYLRLLSAGKRLGGCLARSGGRMGVLRSRNHEKPVNPHLFNPPSPTPQGSTENREKWTSGELHKILNLPFPLIVENPPYGDQ